MLKSILIFYPKFVVGRFSCQRRDTFDLLMGRLAGGYAVCLDMLFCEPMGDDRQHKSSFNLNGRGEPLLMKTLRVECAVVLSTITPHIAFPFF